MMVYSHTLLGISCWAGAVYLVPKLPAVEIGGWVAVLIGSLLPDLDHPKSFLGRRLPFVSIPLSRWLGHRGFTHSLLAALFFIILSYFAFQMKPVTLRYTLSSWHLHGTLYPSWLIALSVGYLSHLMGDWLTVGGIPLLWPHRERFRAPFFFATGQSGEYLVDLSLILWLYWWSLTTFPHAMDSLGKIIHII